MEQTVINQIHWPSKYSVVPWKRMKILCIRDHSENITQERVEAFEGDAQILPFIGRWGNGGRGAQILPVLGRRRGEAQILPNSNNKII